MRRAQAQVRDFHSAMGIPVRDWSEPGLQNEELRWDLIDEEYWELREAIDEGDIVKAADALADLAYVTIGAAVEWGIDLSAVWDEVHAANMRKVGGPVREDGKRLKPEGWVGPDIEGVLRRQWAKDD